MKRKEVFILIFLFILASFLRFYRIGDIPFGLNNDAAWEGSAALAILRGNASPYLPYAAEGWRGEGLFRLMVTFFTFFMGSNPLTIRLSSVVWGLLTIVPLFLFIKLLFGMKLAFLTTFFVATSGWHITMSKTGWRAIGVPLFSLSTFYFFFRGLKSKRNSDFILAGVMLAGSLYTYDAARILPFFFLFWLILLLLTERNFLKTHFTNLLLMNFSFLLVISPLIIYVIHHWANFTSRADFLFIGHQIDKVGNLIPLWNNLITSALLFNFRANGNDFFIYDPLIDKPLSWLLPIGFSLIFVKIFKDRDTNYLFILLWFLASLIPGILSVPNGNRGIGTVPTVYFFTALGLVFLTDSMSSVLKEGKKLFSHLLITAFLIITALSTYQNYLGPNRKEIPGFYPETFIVAQYIKTIWDKYDIYLTDNYPRETLTCLLYRDGNPFKKNYAWLENRYTFLNISRNLACLGQQGTVLGTRQPEKGAAFFMFAIPENESLTQTFLKENPNAQKFYLWYDNNNIHRKASLVILVPPKLQ